MTTGEFADLVQKMREAQKAYFLSRSPSCLNVSKRLEAQVDKALKVRQERILASQSPTLF